MSIFRLSVKICKKLVILIDLREPVGNQGVGFGRLYLMLIVFFIFESFPCVLQIKFIVKEKRLISILYNFKGICVDSGQDITWNTHILLQTAWLPALVPLTLASCCCAPRNDSSSWIRATHVRDLDWGQDPDFGLVLPNCCRQSGSEPAEGRSSNSVSLFVPLHFE